MHSTTVRMPVAMALLMIVVIMMVIVFMFIQCVILVIFGCVKLQVLSLMTVVDATQQADGHGHADAAAEVFVVALTTHFPRFVYFLTRELIKSPEKRGEKNV